MNGHRLNQFLLGAVAITAIASLAMGLYIAWTAATIGPAASNPAGSRPALAGGHPASSSGNSPAAIVTSTQPPKPSPAELLNTRFARDIKPIIEEYCFDCHGNGKNKGELSLEKYTHFTHVQADHRTWQTVSDMLQQRVMPPRNKARPTTQQVVAITQWIEDAVNFYDCSGPRDPGRVTIRRLNRTEYNNTIRDLIGVDFQPAADFPADDTGYGFDNIADVLTMSPLLAEKYLAAAEQIMDKAIVTEGMKRMLVRYDAAEMQNTVGQQVNDSAGWNLTANGEVYKEHQIPVTADYEIRVRAGADQAGPDIAKMTVRIDKKDIKTFEVKSSRRNPQAYTIRLKLESGKRRIAAAFINNYVDEKNPNPRQRKRNLVIEKVEIEGPYNPPPPPPNDLHKRLLFATPGGGISDEQAARQILARFLPRAFRRPVLTDEVERFVKLFAATRAQGEAFASAMKVTFAAALVSPQFLFRIEQDPAQPPAGGVYAISDHELANRLSYFLWSTMPDEQLFASAASGKLREPAALDAQVRRMLLDGKAAELVSNFVGQWLELRNLAEIVPDPSKFPQFDKRLRSAMRREAELFFENLIREDRSILELIDADYTFVNERLAKHYGIDGVSGERFTKVSVAGTPRGGVLGMASVLTVTAMPTRTSPVKRGKWVLEQILGAAPPPAPPDVPPLSEKTKDVESASLRIRLEQHRADPNCAVCHNRMDAIGFSMENFDAIGQWRDRDGNFPIDAAGALPDGQIINGPAGLKSVVLARKREFVRNLAEKMLTYALGRGMEQFDRCTIKDICDHVEKNDYRFSSLISGIVYSDAFQKRRAKQVTP